MSFSDTVDPIRPCAMVARGVSAFEFDGLLDAGDRVDGRAENVSFRVVVQIPGGLLNLVELGLALETVEQEDSGILGQAQSGRDAGKIGGLLVFEFLIELNGFRNGGAGGAVFLVFFCGGPID